MIPNIRNGPPAHLSDIEIDKIRKVVYKILVERCTIEEANAVFKHHQYQTYTIDLSKSYANNLFIPASFIVVGIKNFLRINFPPGYPGDGSSKLNLKEQRCII